MLLSFQTGFNMSMLLLSVLSWIVLWAEPRYLKLVSLKLLFIYFDLCVDATGVVCHQLGLLGTGLHA